MCVCMYVCVCVQSHVARWHLLRETLRTRYTSAPELGKRQTPKLRMYVYVCTYTHIHTYMCIHMNIHMCIYAHKYIYVYVYV